MKKKIYTLFFLIILISTNALAETFLSLKKNKVNVRYGPSFESDIKYVYKKINFPIKQIDKKENFRRIIDLKNILNIGQNLNGYILILDLLNLNFRKAKINKRKKCLCN